MRSRALLTLCLVVPLLTFATAHCDSKEERASARPHLTTPRRISIAGPLPPPPGVPTVQVVIEGAITQRFDGPGGDCSHQGSELWFNLSFGDFTGTDSGNLAVVDRDGTGPAAPTVTVNASDWRWEGGASSGRIAVAPDAGSVDLELSLTRSTELLPGVDAGPPPNGPVRVRGRIACGVRAPSPVMPTEVLRLLGESSGGEPRAYSTFDFGRARDLQNASVVVEAARAESVLAEVQARLPAGLVAWVGTTNWLSDDMRQGVAEVAVGAAREPLDALRHARSDGVNYDIQNEGVVRKLRTWDTRYGIRILHAETDTVELALVRRPRDMLAFAREVYEFCPDVVDQGAETVERLASEIDRTGRVYLWWD